MTLEKILCFHTCWKDSGKAYIRFSVTLYDMLFIERATYFNSVEDATHGCLNAYWRDRVEKEILFFIFYLFFGEK